MTIKYCVSGDCVTALLHRLTLELGDFEGFLYGKQSSVTLDKLKDDGTYENFQRVSIENVVLVKENKIIHCQSGAKEYFDEVPAGMKILGWVAGRTNVPCFPSLTDKTTFSYLSSVFSDTPLIFAIFTYTPATLARIIELEQVSPASYVSFEYKFFNFLGSFVGIKVEIENLSETNTKYNSEQFTMEVDTRNDSNFAEILPSMPRLLISECEICIGEIQELIPQARTLQFELEQALEENLRLKYSFHQSLNKP